jgi:hypothetical protein
MCRGVAGMAMVVVLVVVSAAAAAAAVESLSFLQGQHNLLGKESHDGQRLPPASVPASATKGRCKFFTCVSSPSSPLHF